MTDQNELKLIQGAVFLAKLGGVEFRCVCGAEAVTECENCQASLCSDCADFTQYEDVDVCKDEQACARRIDD